MISRTIGRRYAKALMAVAAERRESPEELLGELEAVLGALAGEPRFASLLENPKILEADRLRSFDKLLDALGPRPLVRRFLRILLEKGRLGALPDVVAEFRTLADDRAGVLRATVVSAAPLAEADAARLRAALGTRYGKSVELVASVDPALLGGMIVRIGSLSFDGSIRSQLSAIHRKLLEEVPF